MRRFSVSCLSAVLLSVLAACGGGGGGTNSVGGAGCDGYALIQWVA